MAEYDDIDPRLQQRSRVAPQYNPSAGHLTIAFRYASTVLPHVFARKEFWFFMALHLTIALLYYYGMIPGRFKAKMPYTRMDWSDVQVVTAITTFFEVFYTNQCFSRYQALFTLTRRMVTDLTHICLEVRLYLYKEHTSASRLIIRYLFAAFLMFFENEVSGTVHDGLNRERLLRPDELAFLERFEEQHKPLVVLHWSAEVFIHTHKATSLPANVQKSILDKIYKIYGGMRDLVDTLSLPVPFQYFHLLNLMVCVNLFLWAWIMGASDSAGGTMVFFFAAVIFLGMMELASQLADPFGDDEVDFPVIRWIMEFFQRGEMLFESGAAASLQARWAGDLPDEGRLLLGVAATRPLDPDDTPRMTWPCESATASWRAGRRSKQGELAPHENPANQDATQGDGDDGDD